MDLKPKKGALSICLAGCAHIVMSRSPGRIKTPRIFACSGDGGSEGAVRDDDSNAGLLRELLLFWACASMAAPKCSHASKKATVFLPAFTNLPAMRLRVNYQNAAIWRALQ